MVELHAYRQSESRPLGTTSELLHMKPYPILTRSLLTVTVPTGLFVAVVCAFVARQNGTLWSFGQASLVGLVAGIAVGLLLDWQVRRVPQGWLAEMRTWLEEGRS